MTFPIDTSSYSGVQRSSTTTTNSQGTGEVAPLGTSSATQDVIVTSTGLGSYNVHGDSVEVGQIPTPTGYFASLGDQDISSYLAELASSQQNLQANATGSGPSGTSGTSSSAGNQDAAMDAATELDNAWAAFNSADPDAKDFVKVQQRVQKALQFYQMAIQIMNAVFEAKKATSQGIRY